MTSAKLTVKSQITIPRQVREKLGLGCGDRIVFEPCPDGRFIVTKAAPIKRSDGAARRRLATATPAAGDEDRVISRMIAGDDQRIRSGT